MSEIFNNLGVWVAICAACALLAIIQSLLFVLVGYLGKSIWNRVARVYSLHVIWYWLNRLESEGTHCFEKAESATERKS